MQLAYYATQAVYLNGRAARTTKRERIENGLERQRHGN